MFKWISDWYEDTSFIKKIRDIGPLIMIFILLIFFLMIGYAAYGRTFFVGREIPLVADPDVPFLKPAIVQITLVDTTHGISNIDPWLDSTHPYGDLNRDGVCDSVDKNLWDNVWEFPERSKHSQWIIQREKKCASYAPKVHTYIELVKGRQYIGRTSPPITYYMLVGPDIPLIRLVTIRILLLDATDETFNIDP